MNQQIDKAQARLLLIPVAGILLFFILYIIATHFYPGGSQADLHSNGFSWVHNYWCNLLNEKAMNGQINPARSFAIAGMVVLCIALSVFWYLLPKHLPIGKRKGLIIQIAGIASMIIALFLFTSLHDVVTNVASLLGIIAMIGMYAALYKNKWYQLFAWGIFNLLLVGINNYLYYTHDMLVYLPVVQKISFISFLAFISCICLKLRYATL